MKLIFFVLIVNLILIVNTKKFRAIMNDEILDYEIDKSVAHYSTYFLRSNSWVEEVDDENVMVGGYVECVKSMDRNLPIRLSVRTQYFQHSRWHEGSVQLTRLDLCKEFQLSDRYWYNVTKLWTSDVCPPQKGDKWVITNQTLSAVLDVPPSMPMVPWRGYFLLSQGLLGHEKIKTGFGIQLEGVPV